MIDAAPHDMETIKKALARHVPDCEVRAFGSRVTWTAKTASDIDLVIIGDTALPRKTLMQLKNDLETSAIPFTIDILDWHRISQEFRQNISKRFEIVQSKQGRKLIPDGWKILQVSEFADVVGGGTPSTKQEVFWNGDIPWLTPKDLSDHLGRYISHGERNISRPGLENSSAKLVPAGAVLLTSRAPVGYVAISEKPVSTNQGFRNLIVKAGFHPELIYYLLLNSTEYLRSQASGSTFPEISGSTLKSLAFLVPPLIEQRAIAHILGTLDDKIELNRRMSQTLEAMARAIFKSWFVDFGPVRAKAEGRDSGLPPDLAALFPDSFEDSELGEIPKGWRVNKIRDLASSIQYGLTQSASVEKNGPNFLRITDIQGGTVDWSTVPFCKVTPEEYERYRLKPGDILVARTGASTGENVYIACVPDAVFASYLVRFQFESPAIARIVGGFMRTSAYFDHVAGSIGGSAQPNASAQVLADAEVVIPTPEIADLFATFASQLDKRRAANTDESSTLAALRDALLPKLLSGEIRVKNEGKFVEATI